jgi:hypothetical protein
VTTRKSSPLSPCGRGLEPAPAKAGGEGARLMMRFVCHVPLMPRGSHFSCFAKKSNQKKATPTIGLFLRCSEKSGTARNSLSLKQRAVLIAFFLRFSGPINGDPSNRCLIASRWDYESPDAISGRPLSKLCRYILGCNADCRV